MKKTTVFFLLFALISCNQTADKVQTSSENKEQSDNNACRNSEYLAQSILWLQHSPEMRALYLQSYNVAKMALEFNLKHKKFPKKRNAVVVDIDETILNNSPYEAWLYINDKVYSDSSWNAWINESNAEPLPGAKEFLNYAKKIGCEVFYVTNRDNDNQFVPTLENLKRFNLPYADENHLLLKTQGDTTSTGKSSKERRRMKIENEFNFEILLMLGDQITDFNKSFDNSNLASESSIKDSVDKYQDYFSSRFIIIPNPMYSDWLRTILIGTNKNNSCSHLDKIRKTKAISWK